MEASTLLGMVIIRIGSVAILSYQGISILIMNGGPADQTNQNIIKSMA